MLAGRCLVVATLCLCLGCGDDERTFDYPKDDVLRVNHLQCKGTHNSYHVAKDPPPVPQLAYNHVPLDRQLEEQGARQFELDTRFELETGQFVVFHIGLIDELTTCRRFVDCLSTLWGWSKKHPAHQPLFVQVEPKDALPADSESYFQLLEQEILSVWPRDWIVAPDDVRGDAPALRDAIVERGWPTLGRARGKVLFFVDDRGAWSKAYAHGGADLGGRLMFVDSAPGAGYEAVHVLNDPTDDAEAIAGALSSGFLVRTRADADNVEPRAGDTARRDQALASGAQMVSTDYPAAVPGVDYLVQIPGGTPSRCSPVTAPPDCSQTDIENPDFM